MCLLFVAPNSFICMCPACVLPVSRFVSWCGVTGSVRLRSWMWQCLVMFGAGERNDGHLIVVCFLWDCGELAPGQTSHSTGGSIVLQTVPSETHSLTLSAFSESFWFTLILSFFYTISGLFLPCHHSSGRSVIPARRTLTHCKQSRSQRHKLHTILLAFKRLE